jgi:hypothetical protein
VTNRKRFPANSQFFFEADPDHNLPGIDIRRLSTPGVSKIGPPQQQISSFQGRPRKPLTFDAADKYRFCETAFARRHFSSQVDWICVS